MSDDSWSAAEAAAFARAEERADTLNVIADGRLHGPYDDLQAARYPINLGPIMKHGVPPVQMLIPEWLVAGELHWIYAEADSAKTWLAMRWAMQVIESLDIPEERRYVCWFDEELGEGPIVERLLALGADPDLVEQRFVYFAFPSWGRTDEEIETHKALLAAVRPALVIYDTVTDALAEAGLDENSGRDVTAWVKAYPEQARQLGAAQVVLDHTSRAETSGKYAVGSRAKRAKAKVAYLMKMTQRFDRDTVGRVDVTLTKNTRGARLPLKRTFNIGGGAGKTGAFIFNEAVGPPSPTAEDSEYASLIPQMEREIITCVEAAGRITQKKLEEAIPGRATTIRKVAKALASSGLHGFALEIGGPGKAHEYVWQPTDTEPEPEPEPE